MSPARRPQAWRHARVAPLPVVLLCAVCAAAAAPRAPLQEPALGLPAWARRPWPPAAPGVAAAPRPRPAAAGIEQLVARVSAESLSANVLRLESWTTRRSDTADCRAAAAWLGARFRSFGVDSLFVQDWYFDHAPNVVAIQRGAVRPHEIYIIGGHFDSVSHLGDRAPGADDNASGTAAVLECARVLAGTRCEATLQFACFSGEEEGLLGSHAYVEHLLARGDSVVGMINVDMIGYLAEGDTRDLDLITEPLAAGLRQVILEAGATYVPQLLVVDGHFPASAGSDHFSFLSHGIPAVSFFEDSDDYSPYIHTAFDTSGESYNDARLASWSTQVAVASLATLAVPVASPVLVQDLTARQDRGRVELAWQLASEAVRSLRGVDVERAAAAAGPFVALTNAPLTPASHMRFADAAPPAAGAAWYRLVLHTANDARTIVGPVGVEMAPLPAGPVLVDAVERPGGSPVEIHYTLGETTTRLRLSLYDVRGRWLRDVTAGPGVAGVHAVLWDRRDASGQRVARGLYFVRLTAGGAGVTRKVVLTQN
jgi:hypothetical protein